MEYQQATLPGYYAGETFSLTFAASRAATDAAQPETPYPLDDYGIDVTLSTTPLGPRLHATDASRPGDGAPSLSVVRRGSHLFAVEVPAAQSARLAPGALQVRLTLTHRTTGAVRMGSCTPLLLHCPGSGRELRRGEREPLAVVIYDEPGCRIGLHFSDRLGLDGRNAYDVAVGQGFAGTEAEYAAMPLEAATDARTAAETARTATATAREAAAAARQAAEGIDGRLAGKADLDAGGTLQAAQLDPLAGRQTGVHTLAGSFSGNDEALLRVGGTTLELLFRIGEDVDSTQYIFSIRSGGVIQYGIQLKRGNMVCYYGNNNVSVGVRANETYHILFANTETDTVLTLNGVSRRLDALAAINPQTFILGALASEYFRGTIHACRLWGHAFTPAEAAACWNEGRTGSRLHPLCHADCLAEFLPCGLLPGRWRDTAAGGRDLIGKGTVAFDYAPASDLHEIDLDSGIVAGDVAGGTTLRIPAGYRPAELTLHNGNPAALTSLAATWNDRRLDLPAEVPGGAVLCRPLGGLLPAEPKETHLCLQAAGNGAAGLRLRVRCRWYGA